MDLTTFLKINVGLITLLIIASPITAQQWDGAQDFINPIFREGKVGIGFNSEPHSEEILTLSGAILIGNAAGSEPGTIQWDSKNFMGFRGGEWVLLNSFGGMNQNHIYSLNSGNVGIGTTSPVAKLDINGTLRTNNTISLVNGATTYLNFTSTNSYFNGGNVGIGTITPTTKLHIHQSSTTNWTDGFFLSRQAGGGPVGTYMLQKTDGFYIKSSGDYNFMSDDGNTNIMHLSSNGNVGIGTTNPAQKLHLNGKFFIEYAGLADDIFKISEFSEMGIKTSSLGNQGSINLYYKDNEGFQLHKMIEFNAASNSYILGSLAIGKTTASSQYKLDIWGKIHANEIVVDALGADFVFENNYNLKSLDEVEAFIKENKHLPDIPTAKEVEANGVSLGEMQTKLLQKIEELTLYIIKQDKRIKELESELQIR